MNKFTQLDLFDMPSEIRGKNLFIVQLWRLVQSTLFNLSPQFMYGWRNFLLRSFGAKIGNGDLIRPSVKIAFPWKLSINNFSWIGDGVELYSMGEIKIGKHSIISQRSYLCTAWHDYTKIDSPIALSPVIIGDECWIATDVFIAPGVCIGDGTVVGARNSVFKTLPEGMICFGTPAKPIKERVMTK